jgi:hypothetical protein
MRNETICLAIREKRMLRLTYDFKTRLIEPHAYGVSKDGDDLLRAWQIEPLPADWKLFRLDKATGLTITETHFLQPRFDYKKNDPALKSVYEEL